MQTVLISAAKTASTALVIVSCLIFTAAIVSAQQEQTAEFSLEPGYELLFNGKDLTGWSYLPTTKRQLKGRARWQKRNPDAPPWPVIEKAISFDGQAKSNDGRFVADNGTLVVTVPPEGRRIQMLYTKQEFSGDFTLKLQFRAAKGADSGVFIKGKQLQCRDYPNAGPPQYKGLKNFKANDWNDLEVVVTGNTAKCTCNGEVLEEKFAVPEKGRIGVEGDQGKIEYRNIRISAERTGLAGDVAGQQSSALDSDQSGKALRLCYDEAAPDTEFGWVNNSIPMGNGYMGVNVFGGTEKDRIQLTENSLYDWGPDRGLKRRGLNNFAEVFIDFDHKNTSNYQRELNLNEGVSRVEYEHAGVEHSREYFTSYPDKVMAIRLNASEAGKLSFTLRPTIPFLGEGKSGTVSAEGDTITLAGMMSYFQIKFEGQFKVIPQGGTIKASNEDSQGSITVSDADSALILIAVGTNYQLDSKIFLADKPAEKLAGFPDPHEKVGGYLAAAAAKSYEQLLANHQADYSELYDRVSFDLGAAEPAITTDKLVDAYPDGDSNRYLEELAFQFGRYMLICSSRQGTLPPHLQGIWNVYQRPPWSSQYLHDTNVQMAYAPTFSANLPELFESYVSFFAAFKPRQEKYADQYIKQYNPSQLDPDGDNGWSGPFWANPYAVPGKTPIAGFGTGCWIAQMHWDYYDYTRDESLLAETVYPVMYDQANFVSRFVTDIDGVLLAKPSSSPEQKKRNTIGTTFDQQMFYENHHNTLTAAKILNRTDRRLELYEKQLPLLDPIQIGKSGHVKEFREEEFYGEIGDPHHRHTSMMLGLYPGQLINDKTPAWLDAAKVSLKLRTRKSRIGWSRAERICMLARVHDGEEAYNYYQDFLGGNLLHNLFNDHRGGPLFQADGNYGATAGVVEMLMQSQDHVVTPLAAMPKGWASGSYRGLLARGNFEVSAKWSDGHASQFEVLSKSGGTLDLRYPNVAQAVIKTKDGQAVDFVASGTDQVSIKTIKGQTYVVTKIPAYVSVAAPSDLKIENLKLSWTASADAASYKVYRAVGNARDYELISSEVASTEFVYKATDSEQTKQMTFKVTAVGADGRESDQGAVVVLTR